MQLGDEKRVEILSKYDDEMLRKMMTSEEGNYVVQCLILNLPVKKVHKFISLIEPNVIRLCKDKRGCRVIQRLLERLPRSDINK